MARNADMSRKDVIAKYEKALKEEKKKLNKAEVVDISSSDDEDDEQSVNMMDLESPIPKKRVKFSKVEKNKKKKESELLEEEADFLQKVRMADAAPSESEEASSEDSE